MQKEEKLKKELSQAKEKADAAKGKESGILKEKADLVAKAALETKLRQDLEDQIGKLKKKINTQDDMLSKESELATLQSNLEL